MIFKFPKIEASFKRHTNESGDYVVYDEDNPNVSNFRNWDAVEKLDGTNCAIRMENGEVADVFKRHGDKTMKVVDTYGERLEQFAIRGVQEAVSRGWIEDYEDGFYYGELVGRKVQENPYDLSTHIFVPFEWSRNNLRYKSWGEYPQDFDSISRWFKEDLFSLFYSKIHGTSINECTVSDGVYCEGIVFTNPHVEAPYSKENLPDKHHFAKLRRDMFDWYEGKRH